MAIEYCYGCKKRHKDWAWRSTKMEDGEYHWICTNFFKPSHSEFVPERIKEDRKKYFNDIVQPWRGGQASKEFIEAYPKKSQKMFTAEERKKAGYVWKELPGWSTRSKSIKPKVKR